MTINYSMLCPAFALALTLGACGGASDTATDPAAATEAVTDAATDAADTATDAAGAVAESAADATSEAATAVADAIDPGAWEEVALDWENKAVSMQQHFAELSAEEITATAGDPEQLVTLVEQKYGISREEATAQVTDWMGSL